MQRPSVRTLVVSATGLLAGVLLDRALPVQPMAPARERDLPVAATPATPEPRCTSPTVAARPKAEPPRASAIATTAPQIVAPDDVDEDVASFRAKQSAELIGLVQQRLHVAQMSISGRTAEGAVNQLRLYQTGLLDGIMRTPPELSGALSEHIEGVLCEPKASPAMQTSLLQMVAQMPELASARGLGCVLGSGRPEDIVLWAGLDVLRATQLPRGAALEELAQRAKDERTLRRLAALRNEGAEAHGPVRPEPSTSPRSRTEEPSPTSAPRQEENEEP